MDKSMIKEYIARRVAKELRNGDVVILGIGLPTMVPHFLPADIKVILQAEDGIIGSAPLENPTTEDYRYSVDAGGRPIGVELGGAYIDSATSFGFIRGGHVDCTVLGALEVDEQGNLANWLVPGKKVPGMGGAMDLVVGAKKVIVAMEHAVKGRPKILKQCTLPLTAVSCVDLIITEMGVIAVTDSGLKLVEYNPEFTLDEIQAATEARLDVSAAVAVDASIS